MKNPFKAIRLSYHKWQVNRSLRVLDAVDWNMRQEGWDRARRRRFWKAAVNKQGFRTGMLNELTQK